MLLLLLLIGVLGLCAYWALKSNYAYWKKRGVPSPPVSILFGNCGRSLSMKKSLGQIYQEIYTDYPNLQYVGYYNMRRPGIILRDPDLIRTILIKEYNSFHDNELPLNDYDPIASKNPFGAKGEQWKILKNQLTPCFTSKKLKAVYPLIEDASRKMIAYLQNDPSGKNGLDAKELSSKFATEVVASCAFGLEGKSFTDPNSEFRHFGKRVFQPSATTITKLLLITVLPSLTRFFKIKFFADDVVDYFRNIVIQTLKYRKENNVVRNDFLDFMKELKAKLPETEFTFDHILSHCIGFFTDGSETSAVVIAHALYHLGNNNDIQENLYEEIKTTLKQHRGHIDYDTLHSMSYLDAVVSETLRMHSPGMALLRCCTKPFTLPPPRGAGTGPDVPIELNTPVIVSVYGLHYNPEYFPDPERFDPDRFSESNKEHIRKGTYLPFGEGHRNCHGQRFGLMQTKAAIVSIVGSFEISVNSKTKVPLEIDPAYIMPQPKGGIWLNFLKRQS